MLTATAALVLLSVINTLAQNNFSVQYLGHVHRIRNERRHDYYYHCNACGQSLQWRVNGEDAGSHSETDTVGQLRYRMDEDGENIVFLTMLLSRRNIRSGFCLAALLVVSYSSKQNYTVICRGDSQSDEPNPQASPLMNDDRTKDDVAIKYVLYNENIITQCSSTYSTYVFMCDVTGSSQTWMVNRESSGGFVLQNTLGTEAVRRQTNDEDVAYTEAVLVSKQTLGRSLTAILVLSSEKSSTAQFNITCRSDTTELLFEVGGGQIMSTSTIPTTSTTTSDFSFSTMPDSTSTLSEDDANNSTLGIVLGTLLVLCSVAITAILIITIYCKRGKSWNLKWKKQHKTPTQDLKKAEIGISTHDLKQAENGNDKSEVRLLYEVSLPKRKIEKSGRNFLSQNCDDISEYTPLITKEKDQKNEEFITTEKEIRRDPTSSNIVTPSLDNSGSFHDAVMVTGISSLPQSTDDMGVDPNEEGKSEDQSQLIYTTKGSTPPNLCFDKGNFVRRRH